MSVEDDFDKALAIAVHSFKPLNYAYNTLTNVMMRINTRILFKYLTITKVLCAADEYGLTDLILPIAAHGNSQWRRAILLFV